MRPEKALEPFAVEVALEAVADGLVQQDAGPARAEHHGHLARGRGARLEVGQRRLDGMVDVLGDLLVVEVGQAEASTAAARAHLAAAVLLGDDGDRQPHQRPHVGRQRAIGARHQHHVVLAREAGHDLRHARVARAGQLLDLLEQLHLGGAVERGDGIEAGVERAARGDLARHGLHAAGAARGGDRAHGARRVEQRGLGDVVGIGEGRLLAADRAHADALVDAEAAGLDDAFLEAPALAAGVLEVQVGVVPRGAR
jgi:hypothetical protein